MENNLKINNSISNLSFLWQAEFTDETIFQIQNGVEHRFQEVKDRINKLKYFSLINKYTNQAFTVDLTKGLIYSGGISYSEQDLKEEKNNIRLIYFRRNTITMTESGNQKSHTVIYHLGLQWNDNLGNNRQIILKIDSEGNFIVTGE